jgi:hypothetical protein
MKKVISILAVVGLTSAVNLNQITNNHGIQLISDVNDANDQFLDLGSLLNDGIQTVGDAKKHEKKGTKATQLIKDGLKILGDITKNNGQGGNQGGNNEEEDLEFLDISSLIKDGVQTVGDAKKHEKKNAKAAQLIKDGLKILGDTAQSNGQQGNQGGNNEEEDLQFLELGNLITDGVQTVKDAKKHEKKSAKAAQLIKDGLKVLGDITKNNGQQGNQGGNNEEEDLEFLELGNLITDGVQTVKDAKKHEKKGAKAAQLIKDGLKVLGDISKNNGQQSNQDNDNGEEDSQFFDSGIMINEYRATGKGFLGF